MDLDFKIRDEKFQDGYFDNGDSFLFLAVRMPVSNVPSSRVFSATDAKSLRIGRARSSCPEVFCKKGVLKNLVKFTGKHLCQSFFSIK